MNDSVVAFDIPGPRETQRELDSYGAYNFLESLVLELTIF